MPAFNFHKGFAEAIRSGVKRQTIRVKRKHRPRIGQIAYCFTGMRSAKCERLGSWMICRVIDVDIMGDGIRCDGVILRVDSVLQTKLGKLDEFARLDGFGDWESMRDWFRKTHALPFNGDLVKWVWSPVRAVKGVSS